MGLRTHDLQARNRGAMSCAECCTDEMSTDDVYEWNIHVEEGRARESARDVYE